MDNCLEGFEVQMPPVIWTTHKRQINASAWSRENFLQLTALYGRAHPDHPQSSRISHSHVTTGTNLNGVQSAGA